MSAEMIAIIAVGIAIMGVQISTCICLARRMDAMQREIREMNVQLTRMITCLTERLARMEGILLCKHSGGE